VTNKISTARILIFQLYTDLSTVSTARILNFKWLKSALLEMKCQNKLNRVDVCSLNNYFP